MSLRVPPTASSPASDRSRAVGRLGVRPRRRRALVAAAAVAAAVLAVGLWVGVSGGLTGTTTGAGAGGTRHSHRPGPAPSAPSRPVTDLSVPPGQPTPAIAATGGTAPAPATGTPTGGTAPLPAPGSSPPPGKRTPTLTLAASWPGQQLTPPEPAPHAYETVTLTLTVAGPGGGPPATGVATFEVDGQPICQGRPLSDGAATCITDFPSAGTHSVTAFYGGDDRYVPAAAAMEQRVSPA